MPEHAVFERQGLKYYISILIKSVLSGCCQNDILNKYSGNNSDDCYQWHLLDLLASTSILTHLSILYSPDGNAKS